MPNYNRNVDIFCSILLMIILCNMINCFFAMLLLSETIHLLNYAPYLKTNIIVTMTISVLHYVFLKQCNNLCSVFYISEMI